MNRECSCGGRLVPRKGDSQYARFVCNKCGDVRQQKKRQPRNLAVHDAVRRLTADANELTDNSRVFRWLTDVGTWRMQTDVADDLRLLLNSLPKDLMPKER